MKRAIALGTAAFAMVAAPLAAADRSAAPVESESELVGGSLLIAALGAAAVIAAVVLIADDDDDDAVSP
ncbi:hypothetical protein GCM10022600_22060 [Qipengyuania pelagi]|uniref:Ferrochelatase n=1 Tax=Qipengyuania pelagi TaxID=994320 RepID=A0A844Y7G1_9SPHN|nr:hypothetical protein [Qipengyuania pelagi]MXO52952.1 hypothetical protein [Qipengyuania pelagi]